MCCTFETGCLQNKKNRCGNQKNSAFTDLTGYL